MRAGAVLWLLGVPTARAAGAGAVGLDIGSSSSVVAVARRGGVDVVANEVSHRLTPSLVGFDGRMRKIGESAAAARTSSPGNVVPARALIGLSLEMARRLQPALAPALVSSGDGVCDAAAELEYCGERRAFSGVQLLAMLLRHLLDLANRDHGSPIGEAIVAVPHSFTPAQRRAVLDASELAGTRCLGLVSEGAAAALDYALSRPDLPTDSDRLVAFVDAGYSGTQACVAAVRRGRVRVLAHSCALGAGGEALDRLLVDRFASEIASTHGADPRFSARPAERLRSAAERLRRVLSANKEASFSLDCLMGDTDVSCRLTREQLEAMAQPVLAAAARACAALLPAAGIQPSDLHSVELLGGLSRMPALAAAVASALPCPLRRSLNADEAVARGAALAAALVSRHFKSPPVELLDCLGYPVQFGWEAAGGGEPKGSVELPAGTPLPWIQTARVAMPPARQLRCVCGPAAAPDQGAEGSAEAGRAAPTEESAGAEGDGRGEAAKGLPWLRCVVGAAGAYGQLQSMLGLGGAKAGAVLRLEMSLDSSGIPHIAASVLQEGGARAEEGSKAGSAEGVATDESGLVTDGGAPEMGVQSAGVSGQDLPAADSDKGGAEEGGAHTQGSDTASPVTSPSEWEGSPATATPAALTVESGLGLTIDALACLRRAEDEMAARDGEIQATLAIKNELEARLYAARGAVGDELAPFVTEAEAADVLATADQLEDWLYADGADVERRAYEAKAAAIADALAPIEQRARRFADRTAAAAALRAAAAAAEPPPSPAAALEAGLREARPGSRPTGQTGAAPPAALRRLDDARSQLQSAAGVGQAAAAALEAALQGPRHSDGKEAAAAAAAVADARQALERAAREATAAGKEVEDAIRRTAVEAEAARQVAADTEAGEVVQEADDVPSGVEGSEEEEEEVAG